MKSQILNTGMVENPSEIANPLLFTVEDLSVRANRGMRVEKKTHQDGST